VALLTSVLLTIQLLLSPSVKPTNKDRCRTVVIISAYFDI
jgi:hypothetical protein